MALILLIINKDIYPLNSCQTNAGCQECKPGVVTIFTLPRKHKRKYPEKGSLFAPCEIGGCWSCAVEVNGELKPACVTPIKEGLRIRTKLPGDYIPKRFVCGFNGHLVGGVGTPWWLKSGHGYIEVACFASGCNFRCPQCQNWEIAFKGKGNALTPKEAAELMTAARKKFRVDRMAISGGESTLNRKWLVDYVKELKRLNPDQRARIHVDTNASILTEDYIDELVEAGMTDVGPEFKRHDLVKPNYDEMVKIHKILRGKGLKTVMCQTEHGHIGPEL